MTFDLFLNDKFKRLFILKRFKNIYYIKNETYRNIIEYINILYISNQLNLGRNVACFFGQYYSLKYFKDKILKFIPSDYILKQDRTRIWLKNGSKLEFFDSQISDSYRGRKFDIVLVNNYSFNNSIISELFFSELLAVY